MTGNTTDEIWKRDEIESPCVNLCSIHPKEKICVGCMRSLKEIGNWTRFTPETRNKIIAELPSRASRMNKRRGGRAKRVGI